MEFIDKTISSAQLVGIKISWTSKNLDVSSSTTRSSRERSTNKSQASEVSEELQIRKS